MKEKYDKNFYENLYTKKDNKSDYKGLNDYYKYGVGRRWVRSLIKKAFKNLNKEYIESIIDIGCGEGTHTAFLADLFKCAKVIGIDLSDEAIKWANQQYSDIRNLKFIQNNFVDITINSNGGGMIW